MYEYSKFLVDDLGNIVSFICAYAAFSIFLHMKKFNMKWVNILSAGSIGVYCIHQGPLTGTIWKYVVLIYNMYFKDSLFAYFIMAVFSIYIIACIIELIRLKLGFIIRTYLGERNC